MLRGEDTCCVAALSVHGIRDSRLGARDSGLETRDSRLEPATLGCLPMPPNASKQEAVFVLDLSTPALNRPG